MDVLEDKFQPGPDEALTDESSGLEIMRALETLSYMQAQVTDLYFGLGLEKPLTLEEIGVRFGLSRERVRQIKVKAIRRLRHGSRSETLRDYLN